MKSPSIEQINFANEIASTLKLDFPKSDADFTAQRYWSFINENIDEYNATQRTLPLYVDDEDIFYGYEEGLWEY